MKLNPVKRKLQQGKPTFGTWLSLGDLFATRVLARVGFDWLTLDMEHSAIDCESDILAANLKGCRLSIFEGICDGFLYFEFNQLRVSLTRRLFLFGEWS